MLGGLLAILGGLVATWIQSRNARKKRMEEITAERKVSANAQAYSHAKAIQSTFSQASPQKALGLILKHEEWFFNNRLFLPGDFPAKWLSVRNDLSKLVNLQNDSTINDKDISTLESKIVKSVNDAIDEIYKDMNLKRIELV